MVIFKSVCGGAGFSADDVSDIGIEEAKKRVSSYATPFFKIGAAAYYANNISDGVYGFLYDFLNGTTLKQAYLNSNILWSKVEFEEPFSADNTKFFSMASIDGMYKSSSKFKSYEIAVIGKPDFSIKDMRK